MSGLPKTIRPRKRPNGRRTRAVAFMIAATVIIATPLLVFQWLVLSDPDTQGRTQVVLLSVPEWGFGESSEADVAKKMWTDCHYAKFGYFEMRHTATFPNIRLAPPKPAPNTQKGAHRVVEANRLID